MSRGQRIRYLRTSDGVQLAWAEAGTGPCLIKASHWLSHLEYEWESPVWRHWIRFFADHFHFLRWDERGCGMSDCNVSETSPTCQSDIPQPRSSQRRKWKWAAKNRIHSRQTGLARAAPKALSQVRALV